MMAKFTEIASDGVGATFELRSTPYIKRRGKKKAVKVEVWVELTTEQWVSVPTLARTAQLSRPMTEEDKTRWPKAWAEFEGQHGK